LTAILFLEENGVQINFSDRDYENFVVEVAQGLKTKKEIASFLENGCQPLGRRASLSNAP